MTPQETILPPRKCFCADPTCSIPYGTCHCGCGEKTVIGTRKDDRNFSLKGRPKRYIIGHQLRHSRPCMEDAAPFKIDGVYCKLIPLTRGQFAIVWESHYRWLAQWIWYAYWSPQLKRYYAARSIWHGAGQRKTNITMHRQILELEDKDGSHGDHTNRITLDNRLDNLRRATPSQNAANKPLSANNACGLKGVYYVKGRKKLPWVAHITVNRTKIIIGYYASKEEAHAAYCVAAKIHFGEFARSR